MNTRRWLRGPAPEGQYCTWCKFMVCTKLSKVAQITNFGNIAVLGVIVDCYGNTIRDIILVWLHKRVWNAKNVQYFVQNWRFLPKNSISSTFNERTVFWHQCLNHQWHVSSPIILNWGQFDFLKYITRNVLRTKLTKLAQITKHGE